MKLTIKWSKTTISNFSWKFHWQYYGVVFEIDLNISIKTCVLYRVIYSLSVFQFFRHKISHLDRHSSSVVETKTKQLGNKKKSLFARPRDQLKFSCRERAVKISTRVDEDKITGASSNCIGQCHGALRSERERRWRKRNRVDRSPERKSERKQLPAFREWAVNSDTFHEGW